MNANFGVKRTFDVEKGFSENAESLYFWRRERDLNPWIRSRITRFRIVRVRPLRHLCTAFILYIIQTKKATVFKGVFSFFYDKKEKERVAPLNAFKLYRFNVNKIGISALSVRRTACNNDYVSFCH